MIYLLSIYRIMVCVNVVLVEKKVLAHSSRVLLAETAAAVALSCRHCL